MSRDVTKDAVRTQDVTIPPGHLLTRVPMIGIGVGLVAGALAFLTSSGGMRSFAFSWLVAFLFFLSLALGALYFVLIHFATQAAWGIVVRRLAENTMGTLPLFGLLFVPILLAMGEIFPWIHGQAEGHDHLLAWKAPFLNVPFFVARAVLYFVCWSGIAVAWMRWSRRQDATGDLGLSRRMRRFAGPAIIVLAITQTFASIDWVMSLDPAWYSTMFGVYWFAGSFVSFFAFLTLMVVGLRRANLLGDLVSTEHFHDLGKLLFAFTVFWAYIGFSQYFLIWYGNIPEETIFFRDRMQGSWSGASFLLAAGHFVIPFFFFMPRTIKRNHKMLATGAVWLLAMHLLDLYWLVMPTLRPDGFSIGVSDVLAFVAVGGLFAGVLARLMTGAPLVPVGDPRLPESLSFENM
jgi:hypothetical protein